MMEAHSKQFEIVRLKLEKEPTIFLQTTALCPECNRFMVKRVDDCVRLYCENVKCNALKLTEVE